MISNVRDIICTNLEFPFPPCAIAAMRLMHFYERHST